ncbi:UNVERIFIED_ORG: hypothetical protein J2806_004565 [Kosakonia oryzae]|nr:hypothetical protein [Kosakonia oryzae]
MNTVFIQFLLSWCAAQYLGEEDLVIFVDVIDVTG